MSKKVIITGITGQDGSYMAEYCLDKGCEVYGMVRRASTLNDKNFKHLYSNPKFKVVYGDLLDSPSINGLVKDIEPDYFINLAAQSFVGVSWKIPEETFMVDAVGVLKCLEAIRNHAPECRFYNAGSSEEFGDIVTTPQNESHPFRPRSPYGAAKCAAHHLVKVYRESYGLYAIQGLLFNHESERRGEEFVTRKITKGIARIINSIENAQPFEPIRVGNLDAKRDWSHAEDFVDGIWKMLNQEEFNVKLKEYPILSKGLKEYVLASGKTTTVRDFIDSALRHAKIDGTWVGAGISERFVLADYLMDAINVKSNVIVTVSQDFFRPAEVDVLLGDASQAKKDLGWEPKISLDKMVKRMLDSDLNDVGIQTKSFKTQSEK
jgi:GDPmannose 4,6-dehydratase